MSETELNKDNEIIKDELNSTSATPKKEISTKGDISIADTESFNYIAPQTSYKKKHKHKHKHKHHSHQDSTTQRISPEEREKMNEGFVFYNPHKRRRKKYKHKKLIIVLSVILAVIIALISSFFIVKEVGRKQLHSFEEDNISVNVPDSVKDINGKNLKLKISDDGKTIEYNGHTYVLNKNIATIAFMGLDANELEGDAVQADAIYIAAIDTNSNSINIVNVSRETMCDVDVYTKSGDFVSTKTMQLCLAYDFGKTPNDRAQNVTKSLSRIFYNLPFNTYFAMDLSCISTLNDQVGGVTVTPNITFESPEDGRTINKGESVILKGKEAERYVRERDISKLDSNNARMQRQQEYMKGFLARLVPAAKSDLTVITDLYSTITAHSVTNMNIPKLLYLSSTALGLIQSSSDINFVNVKGQIKAGEHAEFYPNEKDLLETTLKVFYMQIK